MGERDYTDYVTAQLPWLRKLAYLLTQDWHRADDVVQTAITQLYRHWQPGWDPAARAACSAT